jgi:molybdate transport system regulatory protein
MVRHRQKITQQSAVPDQSNHSRIVSAPGEAHCLDTVQLSKLEQSFRNWISESPREDIRLSRRRILLIFLLIRYTGAKLNEVSALDFIKDIDLRNRVVRFRKIANRDDRLLREVQIPEMLADEIEAAFNEPSLKQYMPGLFRIDPAHIRRKFYKRAYDCGFPSALGAPEIIRRSRAVELIQSNMPLPVVQKMLGHATPNMTASYVTFSDADMQHVAKHFIEKESSRKTSARNSFFGKISSIQKGDIQSAVAITTIGGDRVTTIITNDSLVRLGLKTGSMITAEVKAPWVILQKSEQEPESTAENRFSGTVVRINKGGIATEFVVRIADGTDLCSVVSAESARQMNLHENDRVWVIFNSFSVVLHIG